MAFSQRLSAERLLSTVTNTPYAGQTSACYLTDASLQQRFITPSFDGIDCKARRLGTPFSDIAVAQSCTAAGPFHVPV